MQQSLFLGLAGLCQANRWLPVESVANDSNAWLACNLGSNINMSDENELQPLDFQDFES